MLQNGVGWMTSKPIRGTVPLAACRMEHSPVAPKVVPRGSHVAPVVPRRPPPAPAGAAPPSEIVPAIAPGKLEVRIARLGRALRSGHREHRFTNGGKPFRDWRARRGGRTLGGSARQGRAEQQGSSDRAHRNNTRHDFEVSLPQPHRTFPRHVSIVRLGGSTRSTLTCGDCAGQTVPNSLRASVPPTDGLYGGNTQGTRSTLTTMTMTANGAPTRTKSAKA